MTHLLALPPEILFFSSLFAALKLLSLFLSYLLSFHTYLLDVGLLWCHLTNELLDSR